jgi:hypothetical protein
MSLSSHIKKSLPEKQKNPHNTDHKVAEGIYVAGTLWDGEASFLLQRAAWRRSHRYPFE